MKQNLNERLKEERVRRNLSVSETARMIGVSGQAYTFWESGKATPRAGIHKERVDKFLNGETLERVDTIDLKSVSSEAMAKELTNRGWKVTF